jgi:hypothetical protein
MSKEETLARWKALAGDTSDRPWTESDLDFFLHRFRPSGEGIEKALEGVQLGSEILVRLREIYEATAEGVGAPEDETFFVVHKPKPLTERRFQELAGQHFQRMGQLGKAVGIKEISELLVLPPATEVTEERAPEEEEASEFERSVRDCCAEFMRALEPVPSDALLLKDPLFYVAGDELLTYHVLWPLYLHQTDITEPFQPHFELWRSGGTLRLLDKEKARLYVPDVL